MGTITSEETRKGKETSEIPCAKKRASLRTLVNFAGLFELEGGLHPEYRQGVLFGADDVWSRCGRIDRVFDLGEFMSCAVWMRSVGLGEERGEGADLKGGS
jgi:hypothetical protein